jgi:hypothetical protein
MMASLTHVFVVGTGRSGTTTIAHLLSKAPGCVVDHEREPMLLDELLAYLDGSMSHTEAVELLRTTRSTAQIGGTRLSGEANQRLSFMLPALADAFPEAKIIWLLRDGRDAVASMHHRGWYHPREAQLRSPVVRGWATTRVRGDVVGDLSSEEWARLDAFGRCAWYWSYAAREIEAHAERLPIRVLTVKLEELGSRLPDIAAFLEVEEIGSLRVSRSNVASSGQPMSWRLWSRKHRDVFDGYCGAVMDRHYPGWRTQMRRNFRSEAHALAVRAALASRAGLSARTWRVRARLGIARGIPTLPRGSNGEGRRQA